MSGVTVLMHLKPCGRCNGAGLVIHPRWEEFWRDRAARTPGTNDPVAYFRTLGFDAPPSEEIVCPACAGNGHTGTERPLDDVIQNLYDLIERQDSRIQALEEQLTGN